MAASASASVDAAASASVDAAARAADVTATLLCALVPPAVRRADWNLRFGGLSAADQEQALRTLLEFHQDVVSPVSLAFAFALPCAAALRAISFHAPAGVIEPGAGNGLWTALMRTFLPAVHASDCAAPPWSWDESLLCAIDGAISGTQREARALFLCWPPLELEAQAPEATLTAERPNTMALEALRAYRGDTLLYIGEWQGRTGVVSMLSHRTAECGQTAGAAFQARVQRDWDLVDSVPLPRWPGFADGLFVFRRRGAFQSAGTLAAEPSMEIAAAQRPWGRPPGIARRLHGLTCTLGLAQPQALAALVVMDDFLAAALHPRPRASDARASPAMTLFKVQQANGFIELRGIEALAAYFASLSTGDTV